MSRARRTTAAAAFAVAFGIGISFTAALWLRRPDPPLIESTPAEVVAECAPAARAADEPFRVEQAVVDYAKRQTITTLKLAASTDEELPARVWVWADYFEQAPVAAPPGEGRGVAPRLAPDGEPARPRAAPAVMLLRAWTSRPTEVFVAAGERRLSVVAPCPICDERPAGKPTFYARVHVATTPPDAAIIESERATNDLTNATPVVVRGTDE